MTDRELLELAARAVGIEYGADRTDCGVSITGKDGRHIHFPKWNPLTDPGDALRLAVALLMLLDIDGASVSAETRHGTCTETITDDPLVATLRAITRAAAEIGRAKT